MEVVGYCVRAVLVGTLLLRGVSPLPHVGLTDDVVGFFRSDFAILIVAVIDHVLVWAGPACEGILASWVFFGGFGLLDHQKVVAIRTDWRTISELGIPEVFNTYKESCWSLEKELSLLTAQYRLAQGHWWEIRTKFEMAGQAKALVSN